MAQALPYSPTMDRLSTELDEKIIQHLVGKEASALSMTSKYYRSLAEPQLYRELNFSTKQCIDLMLLFDTLVDRQDLAKHIHSFTITTNGIPQFTLAFDAVFFSRFQSKINEYERVIREVIPSSSRSRARQWLDRMHLGEPMIDGQLAMIACLAGNMEHLTLGGVYPSSLPITLSVLEKSWDKVSAGFLSSEGCKGITWRFSKDSFQRAEGKAFSPDGSRWSIVCGRLVLGR